MAPPSGTLRPVVLTYERLRFAAQIAHEKVFNGLWTMKAAKVFLRVKGMNLEAVNGITECSNNCRKVSRTQPGSPEFVKLMELKIMSPSDYAPWKIPALWARAGVTLDQHVDVPMHLLFLGITKTVVMMVQEWTLGRSKKAAFLRYANAAMLLPIRLGLDWCKVIPFGGGKLGGYVAENYLAVARLSSWFFSPIGLIAPSPNEVGGNVNNVIHVIRALHAMISRLMRRTIDDEKKCLTANAISTYFCHTSASLILIYEVNIGEPGFAVIILCHSLIYPTSSRSTVPYGTYRREGDKENESSAS